MNEAAKLVMTELPELVVAYGISDEYRYAKSTARMAGLNPSLTTTVSFSTRLAGCLRDGRGEAHRALDGCWLCTLMMDSKLVTTVVSTFTSYYIYLWSKYFPDKPLSPPLPSFDGRAVCYPSVSNLRDYMSWRQADCTAHNNLD